MDSNFKNWIQATKNDEKTLEQTKTFLRAILISTEDECVEHYSEVQIILNYLESDEMEVSRRVEMSVANLLKFLAGGNDPDKLFELSNLRKTFDEKDKTNI